MDIFKEIITEINWQNILKILIRIGVIIVLTGILIVFVKRSLKLIEKRILRKSEKEGEPPTESQKRAETIVKLLNQAFILTVLIIALMVTISEMGIDIGPLIAGAGIVGLAVGFGAQNLVRDIISGLFIILENQVRVGDVAIINGTGGLVEKIKFRTIVLRDLSGIVHVFPNGTITSLSNLTNEWSAYVFDIGVAYKENTDRVIEVMKEVGKKMISEDEFNRIILEEPEIFGVDKLDNSSVIIKGRIKTKPISQWKVGREYLRRIKHAFDENNIQIPFPHRTIYFAENKAHASLAMLKKDK